MARDPKNVFYRSLELDDESKAALKWFRQNRKKILESADNVRAEKKENQDAF